MKTTGVFIMPKIPEILVEVKWKIHFDFFWLEYLELPTIRLPKFAFPFSTNHSLPCFSYERNSEKVVEFDRKFLGYSHIWSTPHVINAILGYYARFWIFWQNLLRLTNRGSRLTAQGSGSQNSLPLNNTTLGIFTGETTSIKWQVFNLWYLHTLACLSHISVITMYVHSPDAR